MQKKLSKKHDELKTQQENNGPKTLMDTTPEKICK